MDILLVDDNLLMQQVLERFLGSLGYNVLAATRADDALELARSKVPALILMDLHLPDSNGADALALIRELPGCAHVPAIAMSGLDEHEARTLITTDFVAYVAKPIDLDAFEAVVRTHFHTASEQSIDLVK